MPPPQHHRYYAEWMEAGQGQPPAGQPATEPTSRLAAPAPERRRARCRDSSAPRCSSRDSRAEVRWAPRPGHCSARSQRRRATAAADQRLLQPRSGRACACSRARRARCRGLGPRLAAWRDPKAEVLGAFSTGATSASRPGRRATAAAGRRLPAAGGDRACARPRLQRARSRGLRLQPAAGRELRRVDHHRYPLPPPCNPPQGSAG